MLQVATLSQAWPLSAQAGATRFKLLFDLNTFTSVSFCKLELPCFKLHPFLTIQAWPLPSPLTGKLEPIRSKLLMYQFLGNQIPNHNGKLGLVDPKLFILSSLVCASWDFLVPSCFRFLLTHPPLPLMSILCLPCTLPSSPCPRCGSIGCRLALGSDGRGRVSPNPRNTV